MHYFYQILPPNVHFLKLVQLNMWHHSACCKLFQKRQQSKRFFGNNAGFLLEGISKRFFFPPFVSQFPDPKKMQINLTGFLNGKNARLFMQELWDLLLSAQDSVTGIPTQFLEQKKEEIKKRMVWGFIIAIFLNIPILHL